MTGYNKLGRYNIQKLQDIIYNYNSIHLRDILEIDYKKASISLIVEQDK